MKPIYEVPTQIPTLISREAQDASEIVWDAVNELLISCGMQRTTYENRSQATMAIVIQHAMNRAHNRWLCEMASIRAKQVKETIQ